MTTRTHRLLASVWSAAILLSFGGCPTDVQNAGGAVSVVPGEFFGLADGSVRRGDTVQVRFDGPGGTSMVVDATADRDGEVRVAAPPVIDGATGELIAGTLAARVVGRNTVTTVNVALPREITGGTRGDVFRAVLIAAAADLDAAIAQWTQIRDEVGDLANANTVLTQLGTQRTLLGDALLHLDVTGTLRLRTADGGSTFVGGAALDLAERLLAGNLTGLAAEARGEQNTAKSLRMSEHDQPIDPEQLARDLNFLRNSPGARDLAGKFGTSVGLAITIITLPIIVGASEVTVVTSAIVAVGVGGYSFFSAWASNQNSDAFLNGNRSTFDATTELISQLIRYGTNALTAGIGRIGDFGNAVTIMIGLKDLGAAAVVERCRAEAEALFCTTGGGAPPVDDDPTIGDGSATRFVVVFYQNFDGSSGTDASRADIQLGGVVSAPDFTWRGFPMVVTLTVTETRGQTGTPLYGVLAGLDAEGNPFPIVSGLMYGDYSRLTRLPGYPETPPLLQNRVGTYVVTIATDVGTFASLVFDVE
ncbi:MAG: hypothetical protein AB7Q17_05595 [Phycisphaerae bacterium]